MELAGIEYGDFEKMHSSLREVLSFIKYSNNADKLKKLLETNENFRTLSRDAVDVLNACVQADLPVEKNKEVIDMCEAIQTMKKRAAEKAAQEATEKTFINTCRDFGESFMDTVSRAAQKFHLSDVQAEALVKKYW